MKRILTFSLITLAIVVILHRALALSVGHQHPEIFFPTNHDTNEAAQIHAALRDEKLKYLNGLTSYWEPEWSTTLVYGGDAEALNGLLANLNQIEGLSVRLTFSKDLSKETGTALSAGSWWVQYSHTQRDTITVRINLAAEALGTDKLAVKLPKPASAR
jgi:hypothetical protein